MLKIRTHLMLMAIAMLLPVVIFSAVALHLLRNGERDAALRGLNETARASALLIDRELASSVAALEQLARSPHLESGDLRAFYQQASTLNRPDTSWTVLLDENNHQLINTLRPFGQALPPIANGSRIKQVIDSQKPMVSDLIVGEVSKRLLASVYVPVPAQGSRHLVLVQVFTAEFLNQILLQNAIPAEWIVAIVGTDGRFIARNHRSREMVGQLAKVELREAMQRSTQGLIRHKTLESIDSYDGFYRSQVAGWAIAVAAPVDRIESTAGQAVMLAALGLLLAIGFALLTAVVLGRRLARTLAQATEAAGALGQGEIADIPGSKVVEFDRLHTALVKASQTLSHSEALRTQAEEEREELLLEATRARQRAEAESLSKDQFLAMLGHELRNPLAAISGAIALGERHGHASVAAAEARAIIQRQSWHLSHLVDDLLDVSRMASGKIALKCQPIDLARKAHLCLESLRMTGRTAGYELQVQTEPVWVSGDPTRIEQAVNNLLVNAFKFTPLGGQVSVSVGSAPGQAVLTVRDSGMGITPELMPRIFDMFVQGSTSLDRAQGGLGIGLALVRQLAKLHGGSVEARSAGPGQGSTFILRLPSIDAPVAQPGMPLAPAERHRWRILLIEDNDDARHMLGRLLDLEGHEPIEAANALGGLGLAARELPDLAIVDIGLPEMSGYEVAQRLRANPATAAMGLIALTGYGQEEDRRNALAAGFDFHLVKSVDVSRLLEVIDLCGKAARLRQPAGGPAQPASAASGATSPA